MDMIIHLVPDLPHICPTVDDTNLEMMGDLVFVLGLHENADRKRISALESFQGLPSTIAKVVWRACLRVVFISCFLFLQTMINCGCMLQAQSNHFD